LTYPAGTNRDFWDWYRATIALEPQMKDGAVILYDNKAAEVARWNFYNAYPVKWTGPNLNASSGDIAMETIELSVERMELVK
jgi:phage tail-like protein